MNYKIKKQLTGIKVFFQCPGCTERLNSPIQDAGKMEPCPACGYSYEVPGRDELAVMTMEMEAVQIQEQQAKTKHVEQKADKLLKAQQSREQSQTARHSVHASSPSQAAMMSKHGEAYRLNLWAWRFFMLGIVTTILCGVGILLQIPALYLAAQASAKSGGAYGERLWRGVKNYFVLIGGFLVIALILLMLDLLADKDSRNAGYALMGGILLWGLIGSYLYTQFKSGIMADT